MKRVYVLLAVALFVLTMIGCAANTSTPTVEQPMPYDAVDQVTRVPFPIEASSEESDKKNNVEQTTNEFLTDWDAITHRAAELADFLQSGISRESVESELGVTPVRVLIMPGDNMPTYRFDLMVAPGYEFVSDLAVPDFEGLRARDVGIIVFVNYDYRGVYEDRLGLFEVWYASADGVIRFTNAGWGLGETIAWHRIFPEVPIDADRLLNIAERSREISDFIRLGLSRDVLERELGVIPVRVYAAYDGTPMYRYDLFASHEYTFEPIFSFYHGTLVSSTDFVGLRMGDVGVTVVVSYDSEDAVDRYHVRYVRLDGIGHFDCLGRRYTIPWHRIIAE